jgi:TPP-dependent pyruvate/acetoin dehydrogenase alpha subunit
MLERMMLIRAFEENNRAMRAAGLEAAADPIESERSDAPDPVEQLANRLLKSGALTPSDLAAMTERVQQAIAMLGEHDHFDR